MGGASLMFLTHKDDIADHAAFAKKFGCRRVMHAADGAARYGVEQIVEGEDVVRLDDDLVMIPVPGHTRGHMLLLYKNRFLFTGDHLAWSPVRETLTAFRSVAWYSWAEQTRSMMKLLDYDFEWVLPGHGRIHHASARDMHAHLERCIEWMKQTR
jgi:glyoxylase-like metal-dependent hydrolase (beta-lactamase superfamily II)